MAKRSVRSGSKVTINLGQGPVEHVVHDTGPKGVRLRRADGSGPMEFSDHYGFRRKDRRTKAERDADPIRRAALSGRTVQSDDDHHDQDVWLPHESEFHSDAFGFWR